MSSLNVALVGDNEFGKELGKLGSHSDVAIYNRKTEDRIFSFVTPLTFPDKLSSMLNAVRMTEAGIVVVKALTTEVGEAIVALNEFGINRGVIILENISQEQVKPLLKGTLLEGYAFCDKSYASVVGELMKIEPSESPGSMRLALDHIFSTKSAGTVGVGRIERGKVKAYDEVMVLPNKKEILIKSLQKQDETVNEAGPGDRVGASLKGAEPEELARGCILTNAEQDFKIGNVITGNLSVNRFYKQPLEVGQRLQISVGLQNETVVLKRIDGDKLGAGQSANIEVITETGKNVVYEDGERFVISRPEVKGLRIVGSGKCAGA